MAKTYIYKNSGRNNTLELVAIRDNNKTIKVERKDIKKYESKKYRGT